jgi:hypothetical protein
MRDRQKQNSRNIWGFYTATGSVVDPDPHHSGKLDPDPHLSANQNPDPHQSEKLEALNVF